MFRFIHEDWKLLKNGGRNMILFELAYKLIATAVVYPLVILILTTAIKAAGIQYLTNEYIAKFLANPVVIFIIFVFVVAFCIYSIYEMIFISSCYEFNRQDIEASFITSVATSYHKLKKLLYLRHLPWFFFVLLSFMAMNITIIVNFLNTGSTVNLIRTYVTQNMWWLWIVIALILIAVYVPVILGAFAMNIFVLEEDSFKKAYLKSARIVKQYWYRVLADIILYNVLVFAVVIVVYVTISTVLIVGVRILDMAYIGSAIYLSALRFIRGGVKILSIYLAVPCSYTVISRLYYKLCDDSQIDYPPIVSVSHNIKRNRIIFAVVMSITMVLNTTYAVMAFNRNPFDKVAIFSDVQVTAHRGSSLEAPENTMSAFQKAVDEMANYIELDVQQTSDGQMVVMHDSNAYRTTGVNKNIWEMTLEEVKELDAGSYYGEEFAGEKVPTLEEVLQFAKGKVKLNIEIKPSSHDVGLEQSVVELIQKYNFEYECVITSFSYGALMNIKSLNPDITVGYILSVAYGDFYNMSGVDFFSINASFLTKRTVDAIHDSGKQVHAWTVNNEAAIKNLANKGVDNIITDTPITAKEVIYSRNTSETLINMLKYVFNR